MSKEIDILLRLKKVMVLLGLPPNLDKRNTLPTNKVHRWSKRNISKIKGMCWHQSMSVNMDTVAIAKYHSSQDSHLRQGGVQTIAYTWTIEKDGAIILCNDFEAKTWSQGTAKQTGDENADYMSVCFLGDFSGKNYKGKEEPTYEQVLSGLLLWNICNNNMGNNFNSLAGHFDFGKLACPGNTLEAVVKTVRANQHAMGKSELPTTKEKQIMINKLSVANLVVDGIWGKKSINALKEFQKHNKLTPDGIWGAKTEYKIRELLN